MSSDEDSDYVPSQSQAQHIGEDVKPRALSYYMGSRRSLELLKTNGKLKM